MWYWKIIEDAKLNPPSGYTERHHVIPKSIGGSNNADNLVNLSLRQHFVCHRLLTKMTEGKNKKSMTFAVWRMATRMSINSHTYKFLREEACNALIGHKGYFKSHTEESKQKIRDHQIKKLSAMTKEERSSWVKRSMNSPETWTEERKQRISQSTKGKKKTRTKQFYKAKEKTRAQRTERMIKIAKQNKGKTWKVINGKRVWMEKEQ